MVEELYIAALLHAEDQWDLETRRREKAGKKLGALAIVLGFGENIGEQLA